jgi:Holliday junction DNA helicase RuvB
MEQQDIDRVLRPATFADFLGQEDSKRSLGVAVRAARARGEAMDHVLLAGPPGLGKTTMAQILAKEMGSRLVTVNAPSIRVKGDLAAVLLDLNPCDVLFIDEIHSLHPKVEEVLYPAMEDYKLSVMTGQGQSASAVVIPLAPFTLVAATTRSGMLSQPLRDRFGEIVQMQFYTVEELSVIVRASASKLGVSCTADAASEIARRSRGTPRIANRLLRRSRDFAQESGSSTVDHAAVLAASESVGVDHAGLDRTSRRYLEALAVRRGSAVGVEAMAALLGESRDTVEESVEPYLMRIGFVERTPKGRVATALCERHLRK